MSASEGLALQALKAYGDHYVVNCCGAAATGAPRARAWSEMLTPSV